MLLYFTNDTIINQEDYDHFIRYHFDQIFCSPCVCEHSEWIFYGHYRRTFIDSSGTLRSISIQRCRCKHCGKVHAILPSSLVPYFLYVFSLLQDALYDRPCALDDSYRMRLKKRFFMFYQNLLSTSDHFLGFLSILFQDRKIFYHLINSPT